MLSRSSLREKMLALKMERALTWEDIARKLGCSPVYSAMLLYGYGQCREEEAQALAELFGLEEEEKSLLKSAPYREPAQPWPPTDPFVYRFYEIVLLYMPAIKDVAHELFGDGIMSAIDMAVDLQKVKDAEGNDRMLLSFNGKWLRYRRF
ncbi:MAG: cyanase [Aquificaceae bacterium]